MSASEPASFDVCGPLPEGVTLLEASAGTGKTFAIAALAGRLVADGVPLERLLLVTFTRLATGELRERVRGRLVSAEAGLARALAGVAPSPDDRVLALLAQGSVRELGERRQRLADAVAGFDAATIATTHGFSRQVLAGLGSGAAAHRDATFVEDLDDLVEEVVDDLYVRRFHRASGRPPFGRAQAQRIGRAAVENAEALLVPGPGGGKGDERAWAMRWRLADAVRAEVDRRKRRSGVMTYDDLLTRLRDALTGPQGEANCARLRERYAAVLVDEFQDTDPVQWEVLQRAFGDGSTRLVLIGDPKQAIYAFRGADVYAYLRAARSARTQATLTVNWRSDQPLLDAYDALFAGVQLGHPQIVYRHVRAAPGAEERRLVDAPSREPLRVRVVHRGHGLVRLTPKGFAFKPGAEQLVARDVAADVATVLSSRAQLVERGAGLERPGSAPVRPRDVAVLVRTNGQAALVRAALAAAGVPAVVAGAGSVFATAAGADWLRLLEALERPGSSTRVRTAALGPFLGWSAERLAALDEAALGELHAKMHRWARLLRLRGVAALLDAVSASERLAERLLRRLDGERRLTDLRHVAQLLHAEAGRQEPGAPALAAWLRQRIADAEREGEEERVLRLDSDAEAVQVLTVHRSKGLEFPLVYVPFAWAPGYIDKEEPPAFHDDRDDDRWTLDVGYDGPDAGRHRRLARDEQRGEDLRLLYVALTRARHQAVLWWASSWDSSDSPLGRLLFARDREGAIAPEGARKPDDDEVLERLRELATAAPERVGVEVVSEPPAARFSAEAGEPPVLRAATFERSLDERFGRASYTAIVAGAHEERVASEPEDETVSDEPPLSAEDGADVAGGRERTLRATLSPLADVPGGTAVGDLVHRVLEAADFTSADLDAELAARLGEARRRRDADVGDGAELVAGLRAALETPLGPLAGDLRLCQVARRDRLDEVAFELPVVGGDAPSGTFLLDDLAALLDERLGPDDPLSGYAARLRDPLLRRRMRGYLTGTLDLVVRAPDAGRFLLVDYKTNRLAGEGERLTLWHYRPDALAEAMQRAHYPLQALLYLVALHRYLRARLPGYDPSVQLGGVLYLFVRGMTGAGTPRLLGQPCGVFAWRPPDGLVAALSDLLDRGRAAA